MHFAPSFDCIVARVKSGPSGLTSGHSSTKVTSFGRERQGQRGGAGKNTGGEGAVAWQIGDMRVPSLSIALGKQDNCNRKKPS